MSRNDSPFRPALRTPTANSPNSAYSATISTTNVTERSSSWPCRSPKDTRLFSKRDHCGVDSTPSNEIATSNIRMNTVRLTERSNGRARPPPQPRLPAAPKRK